MLRKYLSRTRRRSSVAGVAADAAAAAAAAQSGAAPSDPYWQKLLKACEVLDQPTGLRSVEGVASACTMLCDMHCFGCVP